MKAEKEFNFVLQTLNDYLQTLPQSTAIAMAAYLEECTKTIRMELTEETKEGTVESN